MRWVEVEAPARGRAGNQSAWVQAQHHPTKGPSKGPCPAKAPFKAPLRAPFSDGPRKGPFKRGLQRPRVSRGPQSGPLKGPSRAVYLRPFLTHAKAALKGAFKGPTFQGAHFIGYQTKNSISPRHLRHCKGRCGRNPCPYPQRALVATTNHPR